MFSFFFFFSLDETVFVDESMLMMSFVKKVISRNDTAGSKRQLELKKGDGNIVRAINERPDGRETTPEPSHQRRWRGLFNLAITSPLVRFNLTLSGSRRIEDLESVRLK